MLVRWSNMVTYYSVTGIYQRCSTPQLRLASLGPCTVTKSLLHLVTSVFEFRCIEGGGRILPPRLVRLKWCSILNQRCFTNQPLGGHNWPILCTSVWLNLSMIRFLRRKKEFNSRSHCYTHRNAAEADASSAEGLCVMNYDAYRNGKTKSTVYL
jgi:hypothetical protein